MAPKTRPTLDPRLFVLVTVLLGGLGQGVVSPRMPELLHGSSRLARDSGLSATLLYLAIFVSTYRYGRLADRGRTHSLLTLGLLAYGATLVFLAVANRPWQIFALRFAEGLSISAIYVAADFVLGRLSAAQERGRWLSYYGVALSAGLLLGPLTALAAGRNALLIVATLAAAAAPLALRLRVPQAHDRDTGARLPLSPLIAGAAYGFMEAALVAVFPILAVTAFAIRPELCLITVIVSAAAFSLVWGWACDRFGARTIVYVLLALLAGGTPFLIPAAGILDGPTTALASGLFFGMLAGGLYPVGFAWLLESVPQSRYGFASGSFARAYGLGSLAGPLAAGFAAQTYAATGLFAVLGAAGALGLAGCVAFSSVRRRARGPA